MRVRTNIIISEELLAKIDVIAGEKQRRSAVSKPACAKCGAGRK